MLPPGPGTSRSLSHEAYVRIRDLIVTLELPPGSIVNERALMERLRLGRTPIREALRTLRADGGATANAFLMQFQADLLGLPVEVAVERQQTGLGAAVLAGLAVGVWATSPPPPSGLRYEPRLPRAEAERLRVRWREAVARTIYP